MKAIQINHVSLGALELARSVDFYTEVLGLEKIPTPNFGFPVQWLRLGDLQLHLFERPGSAPVYQHVALVVDDFEAVHRSARELGIFDTSAFGHHLYELPGGNVQMYLRDPGGNLIEIDHPDLESLPRSVAVEVRPLPHPQSAENLGATLFLADPVRS